jgi:hypothetical protein
VEQAVATIAAVALVAMATMTTTVAAATIRTTAIAGTAAIAAAATMMTEQTGRSRLLAADERQTDDREEQRDAENQRAIHQNPPTGIPERKGP